MMKRLLVFLAGLLAVNAWGLNVGDPVPDIALPSTDGKAVKLSDFKGSWVVLYFFPKAFTPGCTAESCSLRDGYAEIQKLGAVILGVSLDGEKNQKDFKAKYELPFELLSDREKALSKAFDVLMPGGFLAKRVTFLINPESKIARVLDRVSTATHEAQVREALVELQKPAAPPAPAD
jgi:thioredoxin-dependent peroxiredoxin